MGMGRRGESGDYLAFYLVLCGELLEDMKVMVGCFFEVYRRGLKVNAGKSKVMVLNGEDGLECEVSVDGVQ